VGWVVVFLAFSLSEYCLVRVWMRLSRDEFAAVDIQRALGACMEYMYGSKSVSLYKRLCYVGCEARQVA
jgi:hypothetical protein